MKTTSTTTRRIALKSFALGAMLFIAATVQAAPYVNGTFNTPTRQGTFKFTPLRAVIQFGYEGNFVIAGKTYPGSMYAIRGTGNTGFVWYYGVTGLPAGSAVVSLSPAGTYNGPISFTDRKGNVTESGTVNLNITNR